MDRRQMLVISLGAIIAPNTALASIGKPSVPFAKILSTGWLYGGSSYPYRRAYWYVIEEKGNKKVTLVFWGHGRQAWKREVPLRHGDCIGVEGGKPPGWITVHISGSAVKSVGFTARARYAVPLNT